MTYDLRRQRSSYLACQFRTGIWSYHVIAVRMRCTTPNPRILLIPHHSKLDPVFGIQSASFVGTAYQHIFPVRKVPHFESVKTELAFLSNQLSSKRIITKCVVPISHAEGVCVVPVWIPGYRPDSRITRSFNPTFLFAQLQLTIISTVVK